MEIRAAFHKKLREIQDDILFMGSMVGKAIIRATDSLKNRDLDLAHQLIVDDQKINNKRFEIEEKCICRKIFSHWRIKIVHMNLESA